MEFDSMHGSLDGDLLDVGREGAVGVVEGGAEFRSTVPIFNLHAAPAARPRSAGRRGVGGDISPYQLEKSGAGDFAVTSGLIGSRYSSTD
jgi:hypothetical protein